VIRGLANGQEVVHRGSRLRLPWNTGSRTPIWVAAYGPRMLRLVGEVADGFILQLADPSVVQWSIEAVRKAAAQAGRDPDAVRICVAAPAYVTDGSPQQQAHAYDQCRWFGGMVGNHVADIVARYGADAAAVPAELTDYIRGRQDYDYNEHGRAGNTHTDFVPDGVLDRFCLIGPAQAHVERLQALKALGVDQFALYLQHDAQDTVLREYGATVMPAVADVLLAKV
jgi:probable F420-dependent oxidoreductase